MYLSYYNLKAKPFQMSTDPEFLWLGEKHREALAILKYAILENKGVLALTGDVGTGKTTLINALLKSLGEDTITATIYDPRLEVLDFFNTVAAAFQIGKTFEGKGKFILQFMDFLIKAHERNQKVLLIIDEAQGINEDLLEELRLLSNLEAEYTRLLNIFFVGQNEFVDILQKYENRALRQRVTIRYHIDPLTLNETAAYIKYRLEVGGTEAPIFDSGAIDEIFFFSGGYPRLINIMCDHALLSGYVREVQVINADLIRECRAELLVSKKAPEKDFQYPGDDLRSLPSETTPTEPPVGPFIPVEDPHVQEQEDEQVAFTRPLTARELATRRRSSKKRFVWSPITIAFLLLFGLAAGYFFYSDDKDTAESFATSAKRQADKSFSVKAGSKNDTPPMVPTPPETSDIPTRIEAGKVGDSRFFIAKSPNSSLFKETIPKETETPQVIPSKPASEENGLQTDTTKPDDPGSSGLNQKTPAATPKPIKTPVKTRESVRTPDRIPPKSPRTTGVSSDVNKTPVVIPAPVKKESTIQISASKPVQVHEKPKLPEPVKKTAVTPVKKPETAESLTKSVQPLKKTPEKYPAEPDSQKKKEPATPKSPLVEKGFPVASPDSSKKQTATPAPRASTRWPEQTVVSKEDAPKVGKIGTRETAQPAMPAPDENKAVGRADGNVVASIGAKSKPETGDKITFTNRDLQTRLKVFLTEYCRIYAQKDLDKFSTFFTPDALEKGKPFRSWLSQYRRTFAKIDAMEYAIELDRYAIQENAGLVRIEGTFHVRAKLVDTVQFRKSTGQISMVLEAEGNSFKVKQLDY